VEAVKASDTNAANKYIDGGAHPDTICDVPYKGNSVLCLASVEEFLMERPGLPDHANSWLFNNSNFRSLFVCYFLICEGKEHSYK
jgi:hypothetical protein